MNKEKQRIAIAEACNLPKPYSMWFGKVPDTPCHSVMVKNGVKHGIPIPDYLNDLNAMAEAEKVKEMAFDSDYAYWLARIAVRDRGLTEDRLNVGDGFQIALTATAAQKAEAFLKALNLWKEDSK